MRRPLLPLLAAAWLMVACGSTTPTGSGDTVSGSPTATPTLAPGETATPSPTPTPEPTPEPSLEALTSEPFGAGWTLASTASNIGPAAETKLLSTIGRTYSVTGICTGPEGSTIEVKLMADGGEFKDPVNVATVTIMCPSLTPSEPVSLTFDQSDYHGVSITPAVDAPDGIHYVVAVGTHG